MVIPEPSAALGLWPAVKAYSGWPETDETAMQSLARTWRQVGTSFERAAAFSPAPGNAVWRDEAGQEFSAATGRTTTTAANTAADAAVLSRAADDFAQVVSRTKYTLTDLVNLNLPIYAAIKALPAGVRAPFEAVFVAQVALFARSVMTEATAQAATAGAVRVSTMPAVPAAGGPGGDPLAAVPPPPPPGSDPALVAAWWNAIPEQLRSLYAQTHPELVGNLDGVPARYRHQANVILLQRRQSELRDQRGRLLTKLAADPGGPGTWGNRLRLQAEVDEVDAKLRALTEIQTVLNTPGPRPPALLLGLDTTGRGRFIVARGDPDQAAHVATFVPGTDRDLSNAGGLIRQGDALYDAAQRAGAGNTAVITWMDYDTPPHIPAATLQGRAHAAAPRLDAFQQGLRATHDGPPSHNTLVGYSYGSTVAGLATSGAHRAPVDDLLAVGSPGTGTGQASEHSVGADHVWVVESPEDLVADAGTGGTDPSSLAFGARVYSSEPGPPTSSIVPPGSGHNPYAPTAPRLDYRIDSHLEYFDPPGEWAQDGWRPEVGGPGTAGLDRMGDIIAGQEPRPR